MEFYFIGYWSESYIFHFRIGDSYSKFYDQEPKAEPPPPEKAPKKTAVKPGEKKGKDVEVVKEVPLDPIAEKLRQQRWTTVFCIAAFYIFFTLVNS